MTRIVVLLLMIASAALFIFVLRAPTGSPISLFSGWGSVKSGEEAATPVKAAAHNASAKRRPESSRRAIGDVPDTARSNAASNVVVTKAKLDAGAPNRPGSRSIAEQPQGTMWSISSESAALYSTNSASGPVVQLLKRGDVVASELELLAGGGRWILVRVPDQNASGFVQRETVARKQSDETTGP